MAIASTNDEDEIVTDPPGEAYALSGEIMLASIVVLFVLVVFMVALHLYARWYLFRLRHRHHQINRRRHRHRHRHRRLGRSRIVLYADSVLPRPAIDRGLDPAVLHSLPVFIHVPEAEQPPPECAVCLSEFEEKEIVRLLPKCNHCFHEECIDMWFLSHSTCPLCRSSVEMVIGRRAEPAVKPLQEGLSFSEPGSSSASTFCDACQHESGDADAASFGGLRKDSVLELTQSCPPSRLLSFKRILSMGMKPPAAASPSGGGGPTTPRGVNELDLESGTSESNREPGGVDRPS